VFLSLFINKVTTQTAAVHKAFVAHDIAGLQQVLPPAQFARFEQGSKIVGFFRCKRYMTGNIFQYKVKHSQI
jgi:hypothetical protein